MNMFKSKFLDIFLKYNLCVYQRKWRIQITGVVLLHTGCCLVAFRLSYIAPTIPPGVAVTITCSVNIRKSQDSEDKQRICGQSNIRKWAIPQCKLFFYFHIILPCISDENILNRFLTLGRKSGNVTVGGSFQTTVQQLLGCIMCTD